MNALQLEFNLDNLSPDDLRFENLQKQLDTMLESQHKIRKKLFAKVGVLEKKVAELEEINKKLAGESNAVNFNYEEKNCLFSVTETEKIASECN